MLYLNERERLSLRRISLSSLCVVMGEDMWRSAKGRKESSQNVGDPRTVPFHTVLRRLQFCQHTKYKEGSIFILFLL